MKKFKYLLLCLLPCICLTGCGEKKAENILVEALTNMKEANSLQINLKMEIVSNLYNLIVEDIGEYAENSSHSKITTTIGENSQVEELYTIKENDTFYTYFNEDGKNWYYTQTAQAEGISFIMNLLENNKKVSKVSSDKEDYIQLEVVVEEEKLVDILGDTSSIEGIDYSKELIVSVYLKDGYIEMIQMDMRSILADNFKNDITKYTMDIQISNYQSITEFEIPKDIKENAQWKEVEE